MVEDKELVRRYAAERSETAFAELVRRHLNMVYGAALRQVNGDTHLAQDLAQTVFTSLAAKAATLQGATSIAGWLYTNTRFAAVKAVRTEARRRAREQEVVAMNETNPNGNDGWNELRPLIDEALGELGETDRESIVLRYFEGYEFSLVGAALGVSENAARMRVDRALEKLRAVLQKRGLAATGAALAAALADSSGSVVPAQLAATITSAALAHTALSAASAAPSILTIMTMKKFAGITIGAAALSLAAVLVVHNSSKPEPHNDAATTPAATKAPSSQSAEPGTLNETAANPDAFQKVVQGHDAQVRARQSQLTNDARAEWEKTVDDFKHAKDAPGVTSYRAEIDATVSPGHTLVTSIWRTASGSNALVFVTPQIISNGNSPDQVLLSYRLLEVSDGALSRAGLGQFPNPPPTMMNQAMTASLPNEQADAVFAGMKTNVTPGEIITVKSTPRIMARMGQAASLIIGNQADIAGIGQFLGTRFDVFPEQAQDGNLALEMLIGSSSLAANETSPQAGQ